MNRRQTPQRVAITELLAKSNRFQTAQDIHRRLRDRGARVGLATVYRTLQALTKDGTVDVLRTSVGESAYRLCETDTHHHHLVCTKCGTSVEIEDPGLERWANDSASRHGFLHQSHSAEIYGLCRSCA